LGGAHSAAACAPRHILLRANTAASPPRPTLSSPQITLLTLRLFKYFKYQPRLAVLSSAIAGGLSDFLHVSLLFGMVLAGYGIVGHFAFGNQAPDWKDVRCACPRRQRERGWRAAPNIHLVDKLQRPPALMLAATALPPPAPLHSPAASMVAVLKLTVYVSDLPSMQAAFPGMADGEQPTLIGRGKQQLEHFTPHAHQAVPLHAPPRRFSQPSSRPSRSS
jgi:hypothetical protein